MAESAMDSNIRAILDTVSDGIYVTTADREIVFWSKGAERITGYAAEEVLHQHCYDNILVHTDVNGRNLCSMDCPLQRCVASGERQEVQEVFLKRKDGERLAVYVKAAPLLIGDRPYVVEVFGELQSVAGELLSDQLKQLSDASIVDQLTGVYNRRYLDTVLEQQFSMFKRHFQRFGVLVIDLDEFKTINDRFGHLAGDEALKFTASVIRNSMRAMDFFGRFGGDEFLMICPLIDREGMDRLGERIVALVRHSTLSTVDDPQEQIQVTVSVGGSLVDYRDQSVAGVIGRADEALYRVKHDGGNWYASD